MRIGVDGDLSRKLDLEAWAAQIAAMHLSVARMTAGAPTTARQDQEGVPAVGAAETLRAQVLSSRQGQMSVQDGLGYVQVAGADLGRSQEVLRRMRVVAAQAADGTFDAPQREALQKYVDRSVQELEGIAEQARYHTLKMLGGTASSWSLPEGAPTQATAVAPVASAAGLPARQPQPAGVGGDLAQPPGVAPVAAVPPTAVPPTTRPGKAPSTGYERRSVGVFGAPADPASRAAGAALDAADGIDGRGARESARGPATGAGAGIFAGRVPIGTAAQAHDLIGRLDTAADLLSRVGAAVDATEQSLLRTIGHLGLDEVRLPGDGDGRLAQQSAANNVLRQLNLQAAAQSSAAVMVEATRTQFDAVTTVLGGTAAAAAVGAQVAAPLREAAMAPRPAVEPVSTTARSSRAESGRERNDRGGAAGGGVPGR